MQYTPTDTIKFIGFDLIFSGSGCKSKDASHYSSYNMCELRNLICLEALDDFFPNKKNSYENKGDWYFTCFGICKADKQDEHKYNTTCTHETGMKKKHVQYSRHKCSDYHHKQCAAITIFLFNNGTKQQDKGEIPYQVFKTCMSDDVGK